MASEEPHAADVFAHPVEVINREGRGPLVLSCDHAANEVPPTYAGLGLSADDLARHIAWDPGALPVAELLARHFDAPLVRGGYSRLLMDVNRPPNAPGSILTVSEATPVPGNEGISDAERTLRCASIYEPYHSELAAILDERATAGQASALVTVHTFTPEYDGVERPWDIGIVHDDDMRLAGPMMAALSEIDGLLIGDNEPYGPADGVYHTIEKHAGARSLPAVMIEIRNDLVADADGQAWFATLLAAALETTEPVAAHAA